MVFKVCSALCTLPQKPSWVPASLWHCSLIIICSVSHGLRKLKASLVTTPLDRRVLSSSSILWPDTVARAGTQMYTSPPMWCTPDTGVRGWRGECGSVSLPWAVCGQPGHNHGQDLRRMETWGRVEKGILQRLQTRWAPNSTEAGPDGTGSTGLPLTHGRKNWEKKKQNPACQAEDSRLAELKTHSPPVMNANAPWAMLAFFNAFHHVCKSQTHLSQSEFVSRAWLGFSYIW